MIDRARALWRLPDETTATDLVAAVRAVPPSELDGRTRAWVLLALARRLTLGPGEDRPTLDLGPGSDETLAPFGDLGAPLWVLSPAQHATATVGPAPKGGPWHVFVGREPAPPREAIGLEYGGATVSRRFLAPDGRVLAEAGAPLSVPVGTAVVVELVVSNRGSAPLPVVTVVDHTPAGFVRRRPGPGAVDPGRPTRDGYAFRIGPVPAGTTVRRHYSAYAGVAGRFGAPGPDLALPGASRPLARGPAAAATID